MLQVLSDQNGLVRRSRTAVFIHTYILVSIFVLISSIYLSIETIDLLSKKINCDMIINSKVTDCIGSAYNQNFNF